jgi:putative hydrolase of the HAD superfamily
MQALILDLDDTLLDDRAATRHALSAFVAFHRRALAGESDVESFARWRSLSAHHWQRFERGEISFLEQRRSRVCEFLRCSLSDLEADEAFEPYREAYESSWSLVPECDEFMRMTAAIPKVIITNGERGQQLRKVQASGLQAHVLGTITPMDCGHWKPHHGIFAAALSMLNCKPTHCLMIGDDPIRDIQPAQKLGMRTFLVEVGNPQRSLLQAIAATKSQET